jgi:hypothetical protein
MIMRPSTIRLGSLVLVAALLAGCDILGLDNYDEPASTLSGRVVYEGQPIGVRSGGVELELWEPGWDHDAKIPVRIAQDGSFAAALFDGTYELNLLPGNGPWLDDPERIQFDLRGTAEIDVEVIPYYTIENETIEHVEGSIEATFNVRAVNPSRAVEFIGLYVSTTTFVYRSNMAVRTERPGDELSSLDGSLDLAVELPDDIDVRPGPDRREDVFVRIGVKTVGVSEMLFSPVHKVGL